MNKSSINSSVGRKIKELRTVLGLTQKQLADELSISDKHLSKIENGHKSATSTLIAKLCTIFKKAPAYFYASSHISDETHANKLISSIIEDLKVAKIEDLKLISKIVKAIIYE